MDRCASTDSYMLTMLAEVVYGIYTSLVCKKRAAKDESFRKVFRSKLSKEITFIKYCILKALVTEGFS